MLIIDLREETELLDVRIKPNTQYITVINIPARSIFANVEYINDLAQNYNKTYLVCKTGKRSGKVKETYFKDHSTIESYYGGWTAMEESADRPNVTIVHTYSLFNLGPQQYMQSVIVLFLLSAIGMSYMNVDKRYINIYLGAMAAFILYQVVTKSCLMTAMIPLSKLEQ